MRYIEKIADIPGGRTSGKNRSGGSTNENSTIIYSVADVLSFVNRYDPERARLYGDRVFPGLFAGRSMVGYGLHCVSNHLHQKTRKPEYFGGQLIAAPTLA